MQVTVSLAVDVCVVRAIAVHLVLALRRDVWRVLYCTLLAADDLLVELECACSCLVADCYRYGHARRHFGTNHAEARIEPAPLRAAAFSSGKPTPAADDLSIGRSSSKPMAAEATPDSVGAGPALAADMTSEAKCWASSPV
eukprot:scaffold53469_cov27-Tisochrysis_lutea.AAC.2